MKPINFPEVNQEIGKEQPQFITLPSKVIANREVEIWNAWKPSEEDLKRLNDGGVVWIAQQTYGAGFHPIKVDTLKPDFVELDKIADEQITQALKNLNEEIKAGKTHLEPEEMTKLRKQMKEHGIEDAQEIKEKKGFLKAKKGGRNGGK